MRILMLTSEFPPRVGGIASHVDELARALVALGHKVTVVAPDFPGAAAADASRPMLAIVRHQVLVRARPLYDWWLLAKLRASGLAAAHDVIHVHGLRPLKVAVRLGKPVVFTNHTSGFLMTAKAGGARLARTLAQLNAADCVIAPSEELLEVPRRAGLRVPGEYIPNGVDANLFTPGEAESVRRQWGINDGEVALLAARRLVPKNGVRTLAQAARHLQGTPAKLIFAGDGPEREAIEQALREAGMHERAVFLGAVDHTRMPLLYRAADISVLPSLMEATSIAGLEAMASARPLVGTRVGGIPAIIEDGVNGLLVPPSDPAALGGALRRLVLDADLRTRMGDAGRARVLAEFAWPIVARRTAEVLAATCQRRGQCGP